MEQAHPFSNEIELRIFSLKRLCPHYYALADGLAYGHRGGAAVTFQYFTPLIQSGGSHGDRACQRPAGDDDGAR